MLGENCTVMITGFRERLNLTFTTTRLSLLAVSSNCCGGRPVNNCRQTSTLRWMAGAIKHRQLRRSFAVRSTSSAARIFPVTRSRYCIASSVAATRRFSSAAVCVTCSWGAVQKDFGRSDRCAPGTGAGAVSQLPANWPAFSSGACALRPGSDRSGHLSFIEKRRRGRPGGMTTAVGFSATTSTVPLTRISGAAISRSTHSITISPTSASGTTQTAWTISPAAPCG